MQNDVKFWVTNIKEHYGIFCSGQLGELVDNVSFWCISDSILMLYVPQLAEAGIVHKLSL